MTAPETELPNGLPLVRVELPGTAALMALVAYDAGSRSEDEREHGVAHFLEHMVFKGGERFPTHRDVNGETDRLGARLNAFTSQELVAFHVRVRAERAGEAIELLADILARPRFDAADLELEQGWWSRRSPARRTSPDRALDLSGPATFGEHPLGRTILGTEESVRALDADAVRAFRARRWSGRSGVALLVGNCSRIDETQVAALLAELPDVPAPDPHPPPPGFEQRTLVEERDSKQSHLVATWCPAIDVTDPRRRAALAAYAMLLGGSLGSRLVSEIREDRGWAYSVRAEADAMSDVPVLYVTAGLDSANAAKAFDRTREIVAELCEFPPGAEEVERARSAVAGRRALSYENTTIAAGDLAEERVLRGRSVTPAELIAELDDVRDEEVAEVAAAVHGPPSLACVGPHAQSDFS
ncbi:MAG: pitrilysin family protein [Solirubrobacterales bacterium]